MKAPLLIAATAAATLSVNALAVTSSPSEFRGYEACLAANEGEFRGLVTERDYLIAETDTGRTYYINATAWKDGARVEVGFTCQTNRAGRLVQNDGASYTRYTPANPGTVQVAGK